ncbi:MAG: protein-L-isoaspartate(D-aspartate) O-methyltransferase [Gemmatimonadetes bacterium]|nr:protein-L-isoaspartate(D-aspartate) O-methyltransferase [Gemmatimonadota bacterium]MYG86018.1 protein-L-isoaspartate(D-aspartate) O-methyltransferase [Gemmatimonadota bacterium]MYJ89117.1 protein-L-isoaspartate(D-aspartate) O-methyltransferase [Gemmatimonadota bacterium]
MLLSRLFKKIESVVVPVSSQERMIEEQIRGRGLDDPRVIEAMLAVPRHRFIPEAYRSHAYEDCAVSLDLGQTVSQPYIVGLMTRLLDVSTSDRILEIGTGSGYQTAILARIARSVFTVERLSVLGRRARETLESLGYDNIHYRIGDGYEGWPEHAPFDGIMVTAAPGELPDTLFRQLKDRGKMVIPIGEELYSVTRSGDEAVKLHHGGVRFVPMVEDGG